MTPTHIIDLPAERAAFAPYNFVPLPERVVPADSEFAAIRDAQDRYHAGRYTGRIVCRLTTESPLYVRCGLTPEQLAAGLEAKQAPDFFTTSDPDTPVIPGSSLRGMLRALVEIVAYSKLDRVTDRPRYFYRAVAAKSDDPLAQPYRSQLKDVRAGYLVRHGDDWAITPTRAIGNDSFIKVRERDIPAAVGLIRLNDDAYRPQQIAVSFTHKRTPKGRTVVDRIDRPGVHPLSGTLTTSGNMIETGRGRARSPRQNHVVLPEAGTGELPIDPQAVEDYLNGLSDFVQEELGPTGVLVEGRAVFYLHPGRAGAVTAFGHSPNFRLPYRYPGSERAATPRDFVPADLRRDDVIDLAEALFGMVGRSRRERQEEQAIAGRLFVSDAIPAPGQGDPWLSAEPFTPFVLASPKPTTFQHYLVQPQAAKRGLQHYASAPGSATTVRGHKLYWHKGADPELRMPDEQVRETSDTQLTSIKPVRAGVSFSFTIQFENLSAVELGALLWVLRLANDPDYRLKLGMGKPLGMGAVQIAATVYASARAERYAQLFSAGAWAQGETELAAEAQAAALEAFEAHVLTHSGERGRGYTNLTQTLRMRCLLALLRWPGPIPERTRYMEIEHGPRRINEYTDRPVLPLPTDVIGEQLSAAALAQAQRGAEEKPAAERERPARQEASLPAIGAIFTGAIREKDDSTAVIAVPGFSAEQALALLASDVADLRRYKVGNAARVEVTDIKTQRSGRKLLIVRPAPRATEGGA